MKKRPENVKNHETCDTMHVVINSRSQAASGLASVCAHLIGASDNVANQGDHRLAD